jgi:hypothetical protein
VTEIRSWEETIAAQYRAVDGWLREEQRCLRTLPEVRADLLAQSVEPTDKRVAAEMAADVAALHRRVPMMVLPDTRTPQQKMSDYAAAAAQTTVKNYTHAELQQMAVAQYAQGPVLGVIRPGDREAIKPYNPETGAGFTFRMVVFGPDTEQAAIDTVARWTAEAMADAAAERDRLRKAGIGF